MTDSNQLDEAATAKIKKLCAAGYSLYDLGDFKAALRIFYQAWVLLPKPQIDFEQSGWVLTSIGDTYFRLGQYQQSLEAISSALHCVNHGDNPFLLLRQGQCLLNQDQLPAARKLLFKAYQNAGAALFEKEPAIYLSSIEDLIG